MGGAYSSLPGWRIFHVHPVRYLRLLRPRYIRILRRGEAFGVLMGEAGKKQKSRPETGRAAPVIWPVIQTGDLTKVNQREDPPSVQPGRVRGSRRIAGPPAAHSHLGG